MKAVHAKRLLKLADFLDALPKQKFDFSTVTCQAGKPMTEALRAGTKECGTVGCAIGWMPAAFPRQVAWKQDNKYPLFPDVVSRDDPMLKDFRLAEIFFGLNDMESSRLFIPNCGNDLDSSATPKQVARHIRKFVKEKQKAQSGTL